MFIDHYRQRTGTDAPWFLPSEESLANIQSTAEYVSKSNEYDCIDAIRFSLVPFAFYYN